MSPDETTPQDEENDEMSASDTQELLGAYALGAVSPEEAHQVENLLAASAEAREELQQHQAVVELLGSTMPSAAPDGIWKRISTEIEDGDQPAASSPVTSLNEVRATRTPVWLTAVAAVLALVMGVAVITQNQRIAQRDQTIVDLEASVEQTATQLAAEQSLVAQQAGQIEAQAGEIEQYAAALAADPLMVATDNAVASGGRLISLAAPDSTDVQMTIVLTEDGRGHVVTSDLSMLPDDRVYQLWAVMDDGRIISAVVFDDEPTSDTFVVDLDELAALAVTEEIDGGVVASENDIVVVGTLDA